MDVLPADGMQEVRGSNPLSSTGQKRNSSTSNGVYSSKEQRGRHDLLPGQPGSGSASPPGLLAWPAEAGSCDGSSGAVTRKNALFARPLTPAPPLAHGARSRVTLAACATRQASHARSGCCSVGSHACGRTAPWRSMVRRLAPARPARCQGAGAARRGATWRILERATAPPGAGQARDGALIWPRSAPGRAVWLTADSAWHTLATPSEHSGRAPSLRRRHPCRVCAPRR